MLVGWMNVIATAVRRPSESDERSSKMKRQQVLQLGIVVTLIVLFSVGCGSAAPEPGTEATVATPTPEPLLEPLSVRGTVLDTEGNPVQLMVQLWFYDGSKFRPMRMKDGDFVFESHSSGAQSHTSWTDDHGIFVLEDVPPSSIVPGERYTLNLAGCNTSWARCDSYVYEEKLYFAECRMGEYLWFTLEDGETIDLGEIIYVKREDPLCQQP
jgi:hypothetical protein